MQLYKNSDIIVRYDPNICTHAAECVKGLPAVFDINKNPWVNVDGAPIEQVTRQIRLCPSGALSYELVQKQ